MKKIHDFDDSALGGLPRYLTQLSSFEALLLKSVKICVLQLANVQHFLIVGSWGLCQPALFFRL